MNGLHKYQNISSYRPYAGTESLYSNVHSLGRRPMFLIKLTLCLFVTFIGSEVIWAGLVTTIHCFSTTPIYAVCAVPLSIVWVGSLGNMWRLTIKSGKLAANSDALKHTEKIYS